MCVLYTSDPPRLLSCLLVSDLLQSELEGSTLASPFSGPDKKKKKTQQIMSCLHILNVEISSVIIHFLYLGQKYRQNIFYSMSLQFYNQSSNLKTHKDQVFNKNIHIYLEGVWGIAHISHPRQHTYTDSTWANQQHPGLLTGKMFLIICYFLWAESLK